MFKRPRFSLWTLHAVVLSVGLLLAVFVVPPLRQARCSAILLDSGATLYYGSPVTPEWIADWVGDDYLQPITGVAFVFVRDLEPSFSQLDEKVRIVESPEAFLPVLRQLPDLKRVTVSAKHHRVIIDRLHREFPNVEVVEIAVPIGSEGGGPPEERRGFLD